MYPFGEELRSALQVALPIVLIAIVLALPWVARRPRPGLERAVDGLLAGVVLLGFGVYTNANWGKGRYFNPYEFFHYYMGAKYAPELGYTRLYDATVLVDRETGFEHRIPDIANLSAHEGGPEFKRLGAVLREEQAIRAPFTPERWLAFRADVLWFRGQLAPPVWERMLHDKGYNATPFWGLAGGWLANAVPTTSPWGMRFLVALDPLLLLGGLLAIGWGFGRRAALLAAACYLTHFCTSHAHFRAAFLRTDWLVCLLVGAACLERGRERTAGALVAAAGLLRVFPVLFAAGPLALAGWGLLGHERRPDARRFALGFGLCLVLGVGATLLAGGGLEAWREFAAKIVEHDRRPAADTLGLRNLFLWTIAFRADQGHELRLLLEQRAALWLGCQLSCVAGLAWLVRGRGLREALCLSYVLVWCLANPAYYYYALLLVPLLHLAAGLPARGRALGLALLFGTGLCGRLLHSGRDVDLALSFWLTLAMGILALYLVALAWLEGRRAQEPPITSS